MDIKSVILNIYIDYLMQYNFISDVFGGKIWLKIVI